jgi:hypothetical protein
MLVDVVRETTLRPSHVNFPEINFKGEKTR